jgi:lipid A disaccharide synthetase
MIRAAPLGYSMYAKALYWQVINVAMLLKPDVLLAIDASDFTAAKGI